jgi:hypothetical protein
MRRLIIISILLFFSLSLLVSIWLCLIGILYFYYLSLHMSVASSLSLITLVNILLLNLVVATILKSKKHLLFRATRRQLSKLRR